MSSAQLRAAIISSHCYTGQIMLHREDAINTSQGHPSSNRFHGLLKEIGELHDQKQADYGRDDDPFANIRSAVKFGIKPWVSALLRLNDKVVRLQSLILKGKLVNESAEDSMRDIAVYALIALVLFEQEPK